MKIITCFVFVLFILSVDGKNIYGIPGGAIKIDCGVRTSTKDVAWSYKDQLLLKIDGRSGRTTKGRLPGVSDNRIKIKSDFLVFDRFQDEDVGEYTCRVDEKDNKHTLYILQVSASPSSHLTEGGEGTLSCQVQGAQPLPQVIWLRPNGQPVLAAQSGKVELNPVALSDEGDWLCQCSLNGDVHNEILNLKVKALLVTSIHTASPEHDNNPNPENVNVKGTRPVSVKVPLFLGFKLWVWVVIGACCLVLVSLVVFTILILRRNRRMRRAHRLATIKPLKPNDYCQCSSRPAAIAPPQGRKGKPSTLRLQQR